MSVSDTPRPTVAFQGAPGAFSDEACRLYMPGYRAVAFDSFEGAIQAVKSGACDRALLPVHNVTAGPVPEMAVLLPICGLTVMAEHDLVVRQQLMAAPGVTLGELTAVSSHPMALGQCRIFIEASGLKERDAFDTAGAARDLAASGDRALGVIAARAAAELYGLDILVQDIQDDPSNWTRFVELAP